MAFITVGVHSTVSQDVTLCGGGHDIDDFAFPLTTGEISIGDNVWIAAEAFVGPNVAIGDNAVLGARAVAMRDIDSSSVCVGNPARRIRDRQISSSP